ncbi:MAG: glycosyltransferase family 4 protein [Solirubrobacteraceae bacterium]
MRVQIVDPSAFTPPYDHALCAALARAGADVELFTSSFAYGEVPAPEGYALRSTFYRHALGPAGSRRRALSKLASHPSDMLNLRRAARSADIVHFQWLTVPGLDRRLLPAKPVVLTAHDLLPREPRPGQARAQRRLLDAVHAVVVHSQHGRRMLLGAAAVDPGKVHVIRHGAFEHLTRFGDRERSLPPELTEVGGPVVLFFGLLRPYKGIETLLRAWQGVQEAELWIVGRPRMPIGPLRALAPERVRFVEQFVPDVQLPAYFRRADVLVLPYSHTERIDHSGVLAAGLAFGKAMVLSDVGGFGEVAAAGAARCVAPDDPEALCRTLVELLEDAPARERLGHGARAAAAGEYSWDHAGRATLSLYRTLLGENPLP